MRHRERTTATLYFSRMGEQSWENPAYRGNWQPPTYFTNVGSRNLFPNTRVEHCYDSIHSGPPFTSGGPFNKWSFYTNAPVPQLYGIYYSRIYGTARYRYIGSFTTTFDPSPYFPFANYRKPGDPVNFPGGEYTWGDVSAYGPVAWKRYRPGKATADAGVFIGEARDIPRMLKTTARGFYEAYKRRFGRNPKGFLKKSADHWLNHQFGWAPFVSDLRRFYRTWYNADRIISQIVAQNGQWQRRGGTVLTTGDEELLFSSPITSVSSSTLEPALGDLFYPTGLPNFGTRTLTRITGQRVWFVGRFRYYIPKIGSVQWNKTAVQRLFGAEVTPALVWELTPWSWLVDWFSNVGDVISNISNPGLAENLAAKYAYVMGETQCLLNYQVKLNTVTPLDARFTYSLSRKVRREANPFGFGLTWDGLSPRQWSILGALGISRMH